jgi:NAD+ kinase
MYLVRTDGMACFRESVTNSVLQFEAPSSQQQMIMWKTPPRTIMVVKRLGNTLLPHMLKALAFLENDDATRVIVEPATLTELRDEGYEGRAVSFTEHEQRRLAEVVDLVICLGGDGTILHVSSLFQGAVPPLVAFDLGSLGFLTTHDYSSFEDTVNEVVHGWHKMDACAISAECQQCGRSVSDAVSCEEPRCELREGILGRCDPNAEPSVHGVMVTLRMRLHATVRRQNEDPRHFQVMNEVVLDRGSYAHLVNLECSMNGTQFTNVQADGVMISTPTGSTAYSMSAGGSIVHPSVQAILLTPICPHSLSFRPMLLPDSAELELRVPAEARNPVRVSFDGSDFGELHTGDVVCIRMSNSPVPTVNRVDHSGDWFAALQRCMSWNERVVQKPL